MIHLISSYLISSIPQPQGSLGLHRWFCNHFPPFFPVLRCPLGLGKLQACPSPDGVFPLLLLSVLSSCPFHCALQDGFGQTWWTGDMTMSCHGKWLEQSKFANMLFPHLRIRLVWDKSYYFISLLTAVCHCLAVTIHIKVSSIFSFSFCLLRSLRLNSLKYPLLLLEGLLKAFYFCMLALFGWPWPIFIKVTWEWRNDRSVLGYWMWVGGTFCSPCLMKIIRGVSSRYCIGGYFDKARQDKKTFWSQSEKLKYLPLVKDEDLGLIPRWLTSLSLVLGQ